MASKKLIVGNWKMFPKSASEVRHFFRAFRGSRRADVALAPPFPYLAIAPKSRAVYLAAQDIFWEASGPFTGEVSGAMLKNLGVRYVIVGHSERRRWLAESDEMIAKKLKQTIKSGLKPILCVGEPSRDADGVFFSFIKNQIEADFAKLKKNEAARVIVAYEPIWAIGSGKPAHPQDAAEAALYIKKVLADLYSVPTARRVRVLYGGSVSSENAGGFLAERGIAGLLVGGESRRPDEFLKIIQCS